MDDVRATSPYVLICNLYQYILRSFNIFLIIFWQVDSMLDVGKPYYGQLQKVQGSESRNVEVTAEPAPPVNNLSIILVTNGHPTRPYQN